MSDPVQTTEATSAADEVRALTERILRLRHEYYEGNASTASDA
jgi:DNA ligase (NAD+)